MAPATRAEISRSRLIGNFARLKSLSHRTPGCDVLAVVKANAYGHGVELCAPWLAAAGAQWLGVTSVDEGISVRRICPEAHILVMVGLQPCDAGALLDARLVATVWDAAHLHCLSEAAEERALPPGSVPVHLELDTGMSRQGVSCAPAELAGVLEQTQSIPALRLEGVFTHFASPEEFNSAQNADQLERFRGAIEQIRGAGFHPEWVHAGNSATLLAQQHTAALANIAQRLGAKLLVRPGLALYGYALPFCGAADPALSVDLEPVLAWKTSIASLRTVEAGTLVGYNGTFTAARRMRLALLRVGYADGLNRKLSNRGHVLVRGVAAPVVGRVSMDLTIIDVSSVPGVAVGDEVVLIGEQDGMRVTADDHALWADTIPYEILCAVGARVRRAICE